MKIGLYFGSFNPIHNAHLFVIKEALKTDIDKIYLVVSPQSPFKPLSELAPFKDRLEMARIMIESNNLSDKVKAVDWEEYMYPSYTAHTLQKDIPELRENEVSIIMGQDNFMTIDKWKEPKYILENYKIYVIPRGDDYAKYLIPVRIEQLGKRLSCNIKGIFYKDIDNTLKISATDIRNKINDLNSLTNPNVMEYIYKHHLYE